MPGKVHLTPELKAAMKRQTLLPHGFQKDQSLAETRASIETAVEVLRKHRPSSWHLVLVGAYTGFNSGKGVQTLWKYIDEKVSDSEKKVFMGAQMREAILKCIPFIGIPRVLSCIGALQAAQGKETTEQITKILAPLRNEVKSDAGAMMKAGRGLWDDVYSPDKLSEKLRNKIAEFHPNLSDLIVQSSYGHAMSPTSVVNREDTSAVAVTVLRVEEDVLDQLTSHVFGLLKGGGDQPYCQAIISVVDGLRSGNMSSIKAKL